MVKMIMTGNGRFLLTAGLMALIMFCCAPVAPPQPTASGPKTIPVRVLLLVPDEFAGYSYTSVIGGKETLHPFGAQAQEHLRTILGSEFQHLALWPVRNEAAALDMLDPRSPDHVKLWGYDYVVIPKLNRVDTSTPRFRYRFEVEMIVEFHATDRSKVTKIKGYGETTTSNYMGTTPLEIGNRAIKNSVEAVKDGIEGRRDLFVPVQGPVARRPYRESYGARGYRSTGVAPVPVRVLLVIPDEFVRYVYTSSLGRIETSHTFGSEAEDQLRRLLSPEFQSLAVMSVKTEAAAMDMLSPESPDWPQVQGYDYLAIPRFANVNSWMKRSEYGFEIDLAMEFYSTTTGGRDVKLKGYGDFSTDFNATPDPHEAGSRALRSALEGVRSSIGSRRDLFVS